MPPPVTFSPPLGGIARNALFAAPVLFESVIEVDAEDAEEVPPAPVAVTVNVGEEEEVNDVIPQVSVGLVAVHVFDPEPDEEVTV